MPGNSEVVRVLLDDHEVVRLGLRMALEMRGPHQVIGEAGDGLTAVRLALRDAPDVVIMDLGMPQLNGLEATRQIKASVPAVRIIMLTAQNTDDMVYRAFAAGVSAYLHKSSAVEKLSEALELVREGKLYLCTTTLQFVLQRFIGNSVPEISQVLPALSSRERQVLQLLAEGCTSKQIASHLQVTLKTAETHRTNLMRKIGAHSVADAVRYAIRNGIIEP